MNKIEQKDIGISIIMPVYNVETYVATAIKSIIRQTFDNWELICVDDGSTDESMKLLSYYTSIDNRIKTVSQKNLGPAKARNVGLDLAKGEYIMFLDSDDYLNENACEFLYNLAKEKKTDSIIFGGNIFNSDNPPEWILKKLNTSNKSYEKFDANFIFKEDSARPFIWLHFIKKSLLNDKPKIRFDEEMVLGEDQIFLFEYMIRINRLEFVNHKFYNYRINRGSSIMSIYNNLPYTKFKVHLSLCEKVVSIYQKLGKADENGTSLLEWITEFLYWDFINLREDLKYQFSLRIKELVTKINVSINTMDEYLIGYIKTVFKCSDKKLEFNDLLEDMQNKIEAAKNILYRTVNSKKFVLGKLMTRKSKRLTKDILTKINFYLKEED